MILVHLLQEPNMRVLMNGEGCDLQEGLMLFGSPWFNFLLFLLAPYYSTATAVQAPLSGLCKLTGSLLSQTDADDDLKKSRSTRYIRPIAPKDCINMLRKCHGGTGRFHWQVVHECQRIKTPTTRGAHITTAVSRMSSSPALLVFRPLLLLRLMHHVLLFLPIINNNRWINDIIPWEACGSNSNNNNSHLHNHQRNRII